MSNQGIKSYGTYYNASLSNGAKAYVNLSKHFANVHLGIPIYNSSYKLSPINLSLIYTSLNTTIDYYFKTGFKLSIIKELAYSSNKYVITNPDLSIEEYIYSAQNSRYENSELQSYIIIENNQYKIVYRDSIYTFNSSYKLILIEDRHNSINKIYIDYEQGHVESIYNNYGESIMFMPNTNYLRIEISKDDYSVYDIVINYDGNYLSNINYYVYRNNDDNIRGKIEFEFINYLEVCDYYSKERIRIKHPSSNVYQVFEGNSSDEDLLKKTEIKYADNYQTTTCYNNLYTYYYFDKHHLINHCVDYTKSIVGYRFGENKKITFKSSLFKNNYQHQTEINNLINDGFCQQGISTWNTDYATLSRGTNSVSHINVTSPLCLYISNSGCNSSNTCQIVDIKGTPLDIYTFRCLDQRYGTTGYGFINIYLLNDGVVKQAITPYELEAESYCAYFNVVNIESNVTFDQIKVEFNIVGNGAYFGFESMCLTKQKAGVLNSYENNSIKSTKYGKKTTEYLRNSRNRITSSSNKYAVSCYDYNDISSRDNDLINDDLELRQRGLFGKKVEFNYNNYNELTSEETISSEHDNTILKDRKISFSNEYTYNQSGEFITKKVAEDTEVNYESDGSMHYLLSKTTLPNNSKYVYNYEDNNLLSKVSIKNANNVLKEENDINYNSNFIIDNLIDKKINKIKYVYNSDNKLSSVRLIDLNNNYKSLINIKYVNESSIIDPHYDLIESKEYGDNGDKYIFEYDIKHNLSLIKYKKQGVSSSVDKFSFEYDGYDRLKEITKINSDNQNLNSTQVLMYDNENQICEIESNEQISNASYGEDDSINGLYNLMFTDSNEVFQSFTDSKESSVFAPEHFYELVRLARLSNDVDNAMYSCFFDDEDSSLIYKDNNGEIKNDYKIAANVDHTIINERYKQLIKLIGTQIRLSYNIENKGINGFSIFLKLKASGIIAALRTSNGVNFIVSYTSDNYLKCSSNGYTLISTPVSLSTDKEYVISLLMANNNLSLFVNNRVITYNISQSFFTKLSIGCDGQTLTSGANMYLYGIIAYKGFNANKVLNLSYQGLSYIFGNVERNGNSTYSGFDSTTVFSKILLGNYKVVPLFNDFSNLPNMNSLQLNLINYGKDDESLIDSPFMYNKKTHRCNLYLNNNKVIYQTGLDTSGIVLLRFTLNDYNIEGNVERTIIRMFKENSDDVKLSVKNGKLYINGSLISNDLAVSDDVNNLAFTYNINNNNLNFKVVLNDNYYDNGSTPLITDLYVSWKMQLGNVGDLSKPLDGFIEMLCINDVYDDINSMQDDLNKLNHSLLINKYDSLNRIVANDITHNDKVIANQKYNYVKTLYSGDYIGNSKIEEEILNYGYNNSYSFQYVYNSMNKIRQIKKDNVFIKEYTYNDLGYLTSDNNLEPNSAQRRIYTYDGSGNITKREIEVNNSIISTRKYVYDNAINKNALTKITDINDNVIEEITYDSYMNSLPTSILVNNITTYLTWEGLKLKSYGNIEYDYDYLGRRISKVTNDKSYKYLYDIRGNMVSEKITNLNNDSFYYVNYLYDKDNDLYGFTYNGNTYYYYKDILGIIKYILDSNGNIVLEYTYDAYGNILYANQSSSINLYNINHYVYKSYYMDYENSLYYLKTRYYNPNWGRFISSDRIEYLDASAASGLNLYAYCLNDPVTIFCVSNKARIGKIFQLEYEHSAFSLLDKADAGDFTSNSNNKSFIGNVIKTHYTIPVFDNIIYGFNILSVACTIGTRLNNCNGVYSFEDSGNDVEYSGLGVSINDRLTVEAYYSGKSAGFDITLRNGNIYGVEFFNNWSVSVKSGYSIGNSSMTMSVNSHQMAISVVTCAIGSLAIAFCTGGGKFYYAKRIDSLELTYG